MGKSLFHNHLLSLFSEWQDNIVVNVFNFKKLQISLEMSSSEPHIELNPSAENFVSEEEHGLSDSHAHQELEKAYKLEQKITKNIAFWNSMADSRFQSIVTILNLFILLLVLSLVSATYNGPNLEGLRTLGWITVILCILCYSLGFIVKICYVPYLERQLKQNDCQGFRLYELTHQELAKLDSLSFKDLIAIQETIEHRSDTFRKCFPKVTSNEVLDYIKQIIGPKQPSLRQAISQMKIRADKAKWWQSFWQTYIVGKTFSIPSITMLVFIITPLSNALKSDSLDMNNAQGWLAVGFYAVPTLVFVLLKCCWWDSLNQKVEDCKLNPFLVYSEVYLNRQSLKKLTLTQLEQVNHALQTRAAEFYSCFSEDDHQTIKKDIKKALSEALPQKGSEEEQLQITKVVQRAKGLQNDHAVWLNAYNTKIVGSIITSLKFLIVMALTFVENYPKTHEGLRNAQVTVGAISFGCMFFGYLFYIFCCSYWLDSLESEAKEGRSSPFTTFRLVYFGNKELSRLEVHELEDIADMIEKRKEEFLLCFPKANAGTILQDIKLTIKDKHSKSLRHERILELVGEQNRVRKRLDFWTSFSDGPIYSIVYSGYVELVVILVTFTSGDKKASATMGWLGVGLIVLLICLVIIFKWFILPHMEASLKARRIDGYSEFNLFYLNKKELKDIELRQLELIEHEMNTNPIEFKRCFPTVKFQQVLSELKHCINLRKHEGQFQHPKDKVEHQCLLLKLNRAKNMLAFWSRLIRQRFYPTLPIAIVLQILWVQSIATDKYGLTVNGFLGVGILGVVLLLILIFKLKVEDSLENEIAQTQLKLRQLQRKRH